MNLAEFIEATYRRDQEIYVRPWIVCRDGFTMSVQGSYYHYSFPRENSDFFTKVEVGFPSEEVPEFMKFAEDASEPTKTVYGWIPVEIVQRVIDQHGGINVEKTFERE